MVQAIDRAESAISPDSMCEKYDNMYCETIHICLQSAGLNQTIYIGEAVPYNNTVENTASQWASLLDGNAWIFHLFKDHFV